ATYLKPAMFWCVGADSDVKDAAVRFINFFANNEACYDIVGIERAVPISSKMREYVAPTLDDVSEEVVEFIDYVSQPEMASPLMNPDPAAHSKVSDLLTQYSDQVRYGEITDLETAAQQFMDEANAILAAE
ncbi:MAG: carbohydrate ABC transporter substrate-binding protein, partial [Eubacteriales bacterium]